MDLIKKNEYDVNNVIRKLFRNMILVFPLAAILNIAGIFIVPWSNFAIICAGGTILFLVPEMHSRFIKKKETFKYVAVVLSVLVVTGLYSFLFVNVMLFWFLPIIVACMYFDKKLVTFASILVVPAFVFGENMSRINKLTYDTDPQYLILHIFEFALQIAIIGVFSISLAKRTNSMLSEMKTLIKHNNVMIDEKSELSTNLTNLVTNLHKELYKSQNQIKNVRHSVKSIGASSKDLSEEIQNVNLSINSIVAHAFTDERVADEAAKFKKAFKGSVDSIQSRNKTITEGISQIAAAIEEISASSEGLIGAVNVIEKTASQLSLE